MPQPSPAKSITKNVLVSLVLFLMLASFFSLYRAGGPDGEEVGLLAVVQQLRDQQVKSVTVQGDELLVTLKDGKEERSRKEPGDSFSSLVRDYGLEADLLQEVEVTVKGETGWGLWLGGILPFLIPFLLIGVFLWFMVRQIQGANNRAMSFGQSNVRESKQNAKNRTTFTDVAGAREAKEELSEVVEFLKTPKKFHSLGAQIPRGVLLLGPPGTGKTLLARAVAGEANAPFFFISGSEFVEMFVGVGASRVRDLFKKAKRNAPCIVFIDEIDAVGRQRGAGLGGSHDEREQTLNQILVEMDGFDNETTVIVLAATNRPDVLDPALLRPGRFDRQVVIDRPDIRDRQEILQIHARKKPLAPDADLQLVAQRTPGFSGADLANLLNEAAILTARRNQKQITMQALLSSVEKVMLGPERKSHVLSEEDKKITAYHEGGHALVAYHSPGADPVHKVSVISRGRAAGYTLKLPLTDRHFRKRSEFLADIAVSLGGFAAEQMVFGEVTTGASSDLEKATQTARELVTRYGMSESLGARTFGQQDEMIFLGREIHERRDYSEKVAEQIDAEVSRLIAEGQQTAERILEQQRDQLELIVAKLMEQETIEKDEFAQLLAGKPTIAAQAKKTTTRIEKVTA